MTLDDLLAECAESGWLVNNLYQHSAGSWRCNLRTATHYTAFGRGPTAWDALDNAMQEIEQAQALPPTEITASIDNSPLPSLDSILGLANLRPNNGPTITRRL